MAYQFAQAGGVLSVIVAWGFGAAVDQEAMDIPEESRPDNQADWHDHYGDRKQMLVFIGQDMDEVAIRAMLDDCLLASPLAEAEFAQWEGRENPFPASCPSC